MALWAQKVCKFSHLNSSIDNKIYWQFHRNCWHFVHKFYFIDNGKRNDTCSCRLCVVCIHFDSFAFYFFYHISNALVHSFIHSFLLFSLRLLISVAVCRRRPKRVCRSAQWSEMYLCATVIGKDILCISDSVCTVWHKTGFKRSILREYGMYWAYSDKSKCEYLSVYACVYRAVREHFVAAQHNRQTDNYYYEDRASTVALFTWLSDLFAHSRVTLLAWSLHRSLATHTHIFFFYRSYRFF